MSISYASICEFEAEIGFWHASCHPAMTPSRGRRSRPGRRPAAKRGQDVRRLWRDYNLGMVLFALFAVSWVAQTWFGWREFAAEQAEHGAAAQVFGPDGYVWNWARATFENWQSEFLQLLAMV